MYKSNNLGLSLYEKNDKFSITASQDSLNNNMVLIDKEFEKHYKLWRPSTKYNVGDQVIATNTQDGLESVIMGLYCIETHVSEEALSDEYLQNYWIKYNFNSSKANKAFCDGMGNNIKETYATKEELNNISTSDIMVDQTFDATSKHAQSGTAVAEALESTIGKATEFGGEIFNNYSNNYALSQYSTAMGTNTSAGIKGYKIYSVSMNDAANNRIYINILGHQGDFDYITYNNTNTELSTMVSFQLKNCYNFAGRVNYTQFKNDGDDSRLIMIITLTPEYNAQTVINDFTSDGTNILWLPYYPAAGLVSVGDSAFAVGNTNHANYQGAFASGKNNTADGKYSFVTGKNNKVGHASGAFGADNNVYSQYSFASGSGNEVRGIYSFAAGLGLIINSAKQSVFGFFNDVIQKYQDKYSIFSIGNGKDNANRSNAFEVYNDGSAELQTQGTTNNSIALKKYVDDKFNQSSSGGSITIDPVYNPKSENAQSGKALAPEFTNRIQAWNINTTYRKDDVVAFTDFKFMGIPFVFGLCRREHTSPESWNDVAQMLESRESIEWYSYINDYFETCVISVERASIADRAEYASAAIRDADGNVIHEYYATKEELNNLPSGGSITIDQTYDPESENAVSGKALAPEFDHILYEISNHTDRLDYQRDFKMTKFGEVTYDEDSQLTTVTLNDSVLVNKTYVDSQDTNILTEAMAYVDNKISSIETALDSIIAIQDSLINGGGEEVYPDGDEVSY